jgi:hypothetical protein
LTSWTPNPWKASPPHIMLRKFGSIFHCYCCCCCHHCSYKPAFTSIDRTNRWAPYTIQNSPSTPGNINQHRPWADWSTPNKTE